MDQGYYAQLVKDYNRKVEEYNSIKLRYQTLLSMLNQYRSGSMRFNRINVLIKTLEERLRYFESILPKTYEQLTKLSGKENENDTNS